MTNYKVCCLTFKLFQKEVELLQAPYGAPAGTRTQEIPTLKVWCLTNLATDAYIFSQSSLLKELISFFFEGKLYEIHHFFIALSDTENSLAI